MLVEKWHNTANKILPVLDVIASCVVLFALLPFAGGLPAIASQGDVLPDTLWFTGSLGGAFLFLAGGAKLLFPSVPLRWFVTAYVPAIVFLGMLRFQPLSLHWVFPGWIVMAILVGVFLTVLRRPWLWVTAGAGWCVLLLGFLSVMNIRSFLTTETQQFSLFIALMPITCLLVLVLLVFHFRYRNTMADGAFS